MEPKRVSMGLNRHQSLIPLIPLPSAPLRSAALLGYPPLMPASPDIAQSPRTVRLKTLVTLRWFAVIGQAVAVLVVQYLLEFELPLAACLAVIALTAWLNVAASLHYRNVQRLPPYPVAWLLAYERAQ